MIPATHAWHHLFRMMEEKCQDALPVRQNWRSLLDERRKTQGSPAGSCLTPSHNNHDLDDWESSQCSNLVTSDLNITCIGVDQCFLRTPAGGLLNSGLDQVTAGSEVSDASKSKCRKAFFGLLFHASNQMKNPSFLVSQEIWAFPAICYVKPFTEYIYLCCGPLATLHRRLRPPEYFTRDKATMANVHDHAKSSRPLTCTSWGNFLLEKRSTCSCRPCDTYWTLKGRISNNNHV